MTLRRLASAGHVLVSRQGRYRGALDAVLDDHGLTRRVTAVVPVFTSAARTSLTSELTGLMSAGYARQVAAITKVRVFPIPAELPRVPISQAWHVRNDTTQPTNGYGGNSTKS